MPRALLGPAALIILTLAAAAAPGVSRGAVVQIGDAAPAFLLKTLDGGSVTGNFDGRPAYINVFTTWCPPCRGELPSILQQAKQYHDRIVFLFVDEQESANSVLPFAKQFDVTPVGLDPGQFAAAFAVGGLPESIFIDRHGVVQYIYRGLIPNDVLGNQLARLISS